MTKKLFCLTSSLGYVNVFLPHYNPSEFEFLHKDLSYTESEHRLQLKEFILCLKDKEELFFDFTMKAFYKEIKKKKINVLFEEEYAELLKELKV